MDFITISKLKIFAHHGVYEEETKNGQNFYVNAKLFVNMDKSGVSDEIFDAVHYGEVCEFITEFLQKNTYKLLEKAVTETIHALLIKYPLLDGIEMELCKPEAPIALPFENVSVTRKIMWHEVALSIGSNLGDKKAYLDQAVLSLKEVEGIKSVICSDYLITKPYGGVEQDDFLNAAITLNTWLSAKELLDVLHEIEAKANRTREIHWGPRTLDMDILFYDQIVMNTKDLIIPHIDLHNREFVLIPLNQIAPWIFHPVLKKTVGQLLKELS